MVGLSGQGRHHKIPRKIRACRLLFLESNSEFQLRNESRKDGIVKNGQRPGLRK